jgi:hypothetical protein
MPMVELVIPKPDVRFPGPCTVTVYFLSLVAVSSLGLALCGTLCL